jgi:hypothetical protein
LASAPPRSQAQNRVRTPTRAPTSLTANLAPRRPHQHTSRAAIHTQAHPAHRTPLSHPPHRNTNHRPRPSPAALLLPTERAHIATTTGDIGVPISITISGTPYLQNGSWLVDPLTTTFDLAVPDFLARGGDQYFRYALHLRRHGGDPGVVVSPGDHHFNIIDQYLDPASDVMRSIRAVSAF